MRINYNQSAILANSCLNRTDNKLSDSIERLSSGLKINHAKDNPAGLAISNRMDAQIKGLSVGNSNSHDGISVVETADGAMSEMSAIIQRISQLAVQAGTDSKTEEDRALIDSEIQQLKNELTRIATDTEFNGQVLMDGTFDLKGYTDRPDTKVSFYSDETKVGKYDINLTNLFTEVTDDKGNKTYEVNTGALSAIAASDDKIPDDLLAEYDGNILKFTGSGNFEIDLKLDYVSMNGMVEADLTGIGAMKIQSGANEGQEIAIRIPEVSLEKMGILDLKVWTDDPNEDSFECAQKAIEQSKKALKYISDERARLGAYQNRMEHNITNLEVSEENMTSSYSRIMDIDMAEEMTEYSTQQILSQSGVSMLAQANSIPEKILQLLQ